MVSAINPIQPDHALDFLREQLQTTDLRQWEGFPLGRDEAILALSEPPHYTACPNPALAQFVAEWEKRYARHAAPAAPPEQIQIAVGDKTSTAYHLHTYHSKIPPATLAALIDQHTENGNVVLDPFAGSGMSGLATGMVAAQTGKDLLCLQNDLSPAATFIANAYAASLNGAVDSAQILRDGQQLLQEQGPALTEHYSDEGGEFDYTIFSDVFLCANCGREVIFWDACVDQERWEFRPSFRCWHCQKPISKRQTARKQSTYYDPLLKRTVTHAIQIPVARKRGRQLYPLHGAARQRAADNAANYHGVPVPVAALGVGINLAQPQRSHGFTHVHQLFTWRNLNAIATLWNGAGAHASAAILRFILTSFMLKTGSKLHNIGLKKGAINLAGQLPNTYYIPNLSAERNIRKLFRKKLQQAATYFGEQVPRPQSTVHVLTATGSATQLALANESIDYCITDPPFGGFVNYAELNLVWEAWLGLHSARKAEAIVHEQGGKSHSYYQTVMRRSFREIYRVLKPGRCFTLVFHNSSNDIWTLIQEALSDAGFVITAVQGLGRGQSSYKQMTASAAIKTDLLVFAHKPMARSAAIPRLTTGTESEVWTLIRAHLAALPLPLDQATDPVESQRQNYQLFDHMVGHHLQQGKTVPLSATAFYQGLHERFPCADEMYFLPHQLRIYQRRPHRSP